MYQAKGNEKYIITNIVFQLKSITFPKSCKNKAAM